jgi:hypothetical protein
VNISFRYGITCLLICALATPLGALAQAPARAPAFNQQELDQMLAPVALYPDALLAQVLMAATYPQEVVEAASWMQQNNGGLTGTALQAALQSQPWDASVKSLCAFPAVLGRMSQGLAWTQGLGEAFVDQQPQVMDTVQALRRRAQAAGNLQSNSQETVGFNNNAITIAPANPQIVYVPTYDPEYAYGSWSSPDYPPYYPDYWGAGLGVGVFAGAWLWGGFDWRRREVNVDRDRFNEFNHSHIVDNHWHHDEARGGGFAFRGEPFRGPDNRFGAPRGGIVQEGQHGGAMFGGMGHEGGSSQGGGMGHEGGSFQGGGMGHEGGGFQGGGMGHGGGEGHGGGGGGGHGGGGGGGHH